MISKINTLVSDLLISNPVFTEGSFYVDKHQFEAGGLDDRIVDRFYLRFADNKIRAVVTNQNELGDTVQYTLVLVFQLGAAPIMWEKVVDLVGYLRRDKNVRILDYTWDSNSIIEREAQIKPKKSMNLGLINFQYQCEIYFNECAPLC